MVKFKVKVLCKQTNLYMKEISGIINLVVQEHYLLKIVNRNMKDYFKKT